MVVTCIHDAIVLGFNSHLCCYSALQLQQSIMLLLLVATVHGFVNVFEYENTCKETMSSVLLSIVLVI